MIGLIGCEESQAVTKEFRSRGHEFYSCDLKPCSGGHPEWHIQADVIKTIKSREWDFIGLHPVCTKMALSGNRHYAPGKPGHRERIEAVEWTIGLWNLAISRCNRVYMENPMGAMNGDRRLPKPQKIQPYYFGDPFTKTTFLWLHGLPPLYHNDKPNLFNDPVSHVGRGEFYECISNGKKKRMPLWLAQAKGFGGKASGDYSETRSKTFPGIARAMATQWNLKIFP